MSTTHRNSLVGGTVPPQATDNIIKEKRSTTINASELPPKFIERGREVSGRGRGTGEGSYMKGTISSGRRSRSNSGDGADNDNGEREAISSTRMRVVINKPAVAPGRSMSVDRGRVAQNKQNETKSNQRFIPAGQSSSWASGTRNGGSLGYPRIRISDPQAAPPIPRRLAGQPVSNKLEEMIPPHQFNEETLGHVQTFTGRAYETDDHTKSILSQRSVGPQPPADRMDTLTASSRSTEITGKPVYESTDCEGAAEKERALSGVEGRVPVAGMKKGTTSVLTPLTLDEERHPAVVINDG